MDRRRFLNAAGAFAAAQLFPPLSARAQMPPLRFADMHSHIGLLGGSANVRQEMERNGMLVVARKIVADGPVIRMIPGKGIQQVRQPVPGQLASVFDNRLEQMRAQHRAEGLVEIVSAEILERVLRERVPAVVLAAEGGDFLDGDIKRLEAVRALGLTHLQLVHYRVSELGDISTERPVHGGLTPFGKEVVVACGRLGILVDVAHGTSAVIEQTLELATRPLIYSHGHVTSGEPFWTQSGIRARAIHKPLALKIAQKGGVIGIWPLGSMYRSLAAYADALLETADALGAEHVGVGSDYNGLPTTVIPSYVEFAQLADMLAKRSIRTADLENILGGNYLRVLRAAITV
jgi:membrane dipeptidase